MSLTLPQYNGKDNKVMLTIIPVFTLLFNLIVFNERYFSGVLFFLLCSFITAFSFGCYFVLCGGIAVLMKQRFPEEKKSAFSPSYKNDHGCKLDHSALYLAVGANTNF